MVSLEILSIHTCFNFLVSMVMGVVNFLVLLISFLYHIFFSDANTNNLLVAIRSVILRFKLDTGLMFNLSDGGRSR